MRHRSFVPLLLVAAAAWLAAGPGGVTVRALATCWHHHAAHGAHAGHTAELPPGTPCFCDEMTGSHEVLLAPATPAAGTMSVFVAVAPHVIPFPVPQSPVPSFVQGPTPPPPNPLG
jgi:hypothetical protein